MDYSGGIWLFSSRFEIETRMKEREILKEF